MGDGIERMTGYPASEVLADGSLIHIRRAVIGGEARGMSMEEAATANREGALDHWEADYLVRHRDGSLRWLADTSVLVRDANGRIYGSLGMLQDVTERKQAEESLANERTLLKAVLDLMPGEVFFKDTESRFVYWNRRTAQFGEAWRFGGDLAGRTDLDLLPDDPVYARALFDEEQEIMRTGRGYQGRLIGEDGADQLLATKLPLYSSAGALLGVVGVNNHIPRELREKDAALRASEREKAAILDSIPDHVVYKDLGCRIVWANRRFADHLGEQPEALVGRDCPFRETPRCVACPFHDAVPTGQPHTRQIPGDDGSTWTVSAIPVLDDGGVALGVVEISRDITRQLQAEREAALHQANAQRAQRLESLGVLAGGIAHDFNNLLAAIMGYGELAHREADEGSELQRRLGEIVGACERARDLVRQILTFSRQSEPQPVRGPLQPIVDECLRFLRASLPTTIAFDLDLCPECGPVLVDPTQFHQVVMNLCTNAAHAMRGRGGVLRVELAEVDVDAQLGTTLGVGAAGRFARLTVSDTGTGMDAQTLDRAFEPFFTTKPSGEGTGLGLSTVHGIIQRHGGAISLRSEPGAGTTFCVYLPVVAQAAAEPAERGDARAVAGARVMVVDDEPAVAAMSGEALRALGHEVETFVDSRDALRAFADHPEAYDLILTDQTMPHLTGTHLAAAMRKSRPGLPVIIVTGYRPRVEQGPVDLWSGCTVLAKPYSLGELGLAVEEALRVRRDADGSH